MAALLGAHIIKVKPPTAHISLAAARRRPTSRAFDAQHARQARRARRAVRLQRPPHRGVLGRRVGRASTTLLDEVRGLRDGGANGSIIGRNTFQRPKAEALDMLARIIAIYQGKDASERSALAGCRLYLVTPPALEPAAFADRLAAALDAGDVARRAASAEGRGRRRAAPRDRRAAAGRAVARRRVPAERSPDLAAASGCDGAHVGQQDMPAPRGAPAARPRPDARRHLPRQPRPRHAGRRGRRRLRRVRRLLPDHDQGRHDAAPTPRSSPGGRS